MTPISNIARSIVHKFNEPHVKEGIKKVAGSVTFAFGLLEVYDLYQICFNGRSVSSVSFMQGPPWQQTAHKTIIVCSKISLVLSAAVSAPGVYIISSLVGTVCSTQRLERVFGRNTIFAINPWHPRHITSIVAVVLAAPATIQTVWNAGYWMYRQVMSSPSPAPQSATTFSSDDAVRLMTLFNTVFSRPFLHMANQCWQFLLRRT